MIFQDLGPNPVLFVFSRVFLLTLLTPDEAAAGKVEEQRKNPDPKPAVRAARD